ncbi:ferrous iron transporter B [Romboutsia sp.]|uniref:ferrous iron transporter B n=1 Tax=Romboutsia sp. TaxID=1965302 RepID=UPI003F3E3938
MKIALIGNPNSGKTTLYNELTGKQEQVGNWAGVTVNIKKSNLKQSLGKDIQLIDLPGAYSIKPYTDEESVTTEFIKNTNPDVIINVVDSNNLERSLFFTTQILELNIPVVIALNKVDIAKNLQNIDLIQLQQNLKCSIVKISASKRMGLKELIEEAKIVSTQNKQENVFEDLQYIKDAKQRDIARFKEVDKVLADSQINKIDLNKENLQDKIDKVVTNPIVGISLFVLIMSQIFNLAINTLGPLVADSLVGIIETFQGQLAMILENAGVNEFLNSLLTDGIIGGVGAVVGFVPLVMILMFLLALVEDSGFMARIALIFDPLFRKIGLSGKSIIPMIVGYGCAIPGIMATRTIKDEKQKRLTALLTPFVPCGAKVPIIALFATAFFPDNGLIFPLTYLVAFIVIIGVGFTLKAVLGAKTTESYFIIELPNYRFPSLKRGFEKMIDTGKDFMKKAGTIILVCNTIVFMMSSFNLSLQPVGDNINTSILAIIATPFAFLLIPIGIGTWQLAAAAITGFIAKEEVVGTLAIVYAMGGAINADFELVNQSLVQDTMGITPVVALAFMFFNLFTPPCFAAIGAMRSEMKSKKFFRNSVMLQFAVGYIVAMVVYQVGTLMVYKTLGEGFVASLVILAASVVFVINKIKSNKEEVEKPRAEISLQY